MLEKTNSVPDAVWLIGGAIIAVYMVWEHVCPSSLYRRHKDGRPPPGDAADE